MKTCKPSVYKAQNQTGYVALCQHGFTALGATKEEASKALQGKHNGTVDLDSMTVSELRAYARDELGLSSVLRLGRKAALLAAIRRVQAQRASR